METPNQLQFHETNRHATAIDMYFEIINIVKDRLFSLELLNKLEGSCIDIENSHDYGKRDGSMVIGKKLKFHSWGGKRGDRLSKEPLKDQVIARSYPPFHSWGG